MPPSSPGAAFQSVFEQVDALNFAVVRLQTLHCDIVLGHATGFFFHGLLGGKPNYWLVTNWHVLAGRNADDPLRTLHSKGAIPSHLRMSLLLRFDQPEYTENPGSAILFQEQTFDLYDANGKANWYQHPMKSSVDIAVINFAPALDRYRIVGINETPAQYDMAIEIGNEVFILGYPLGFTHFMNTPIWKRGSIASEPHIETTETKFRVVIDATTRAGMSGGPVIMRAKTHYVAEDEQIKQHANATRWIGVYASRPNLPAIEGGLDDDRRAEVGFFYKAGWVAEIIQQGIRGPDHGALP